MARTVLSFVRALSPALSFGPLTPVVLPIALLRHRTLTSTKTARIAGKPAAGIGGYVSQLQRVLNIDGTRVLAKVDDGIRVDLDLLRQQFLGGNR